MSHRKVNSSNATTANARPEKITRDAPLYDPFSIAAPVQPEFYPGESVVDHDLMNPLRTYNRVNPQGKFTNRFDPDHHNATDAYRSKLESVPLDANHFDILEEEEREAMYVEQPPAARAALRSDLRDQQFLDKILDPPMRPSQPSAELQRQMRVNEEQDRQITQVKQRVLANPTVKSVDFFASLPNYTGRKPEKKHNPNGAVASTAINRGMLAAIDAELRTLAENDEMDNEEFKVRDAELRKEREALVEAMEEQESGDGKKVGEAGKPDDVDIGTGAKIPVLSNSELKPLLVVNPYCMIPPEQLTQLLQVPDIVNVHQLLFARMMKHESHKQHYNVVEFVRCMGKAGCKYDGCVKVRSRSRIGPLLDPDFYGSFMDQNKNLLGGHDHYDPVKSATTFVIFKFYLVIRKKENAEKVKEIESAKKQAELKAKKAGKTRLTDEAARDIDTLMSRGAENVHLNKPGLYDADVVVGQDEDDGTSPYGSMHDIKDLAKHFMFSCCVVFQETKYTHNDVDDEYGSSAEKEEDDEAEDVDEDDDEEDVSDARSARESSGSRSNRTTSSKSKSVGFVGDAIDRDELLVDNDAYVHTDDEDDEEVRLEDDIAPTKAMPRETLQLTLAQSKDLVGKWKADEFLRLVNSESLGLLCLSSYIIY